MSAEFVLTTATNAVPSGNIEGVVAVRRSSGGDDLSVLVELDGDAGVSGFGAVLVAVARVAVNGARRELFTWPS